jgi:hypothetical protein
MKMSLLQARLLLEAFPGPGRQGRLSALSVFHSKSGLYGAFCMGTQGA